MPSLLVRADWLLRCPQGAGGSSLALAFHTRSTVKACDRPQTLPPTAPLYPRPCCLANYEYSVAMKVILSDMQLSSQIMSVVSFAVFEGRISQGHDHSSPSLSDFYIWKKLKLTVRRILNFIVDQKLLKHINEPHCHTDTFLHYQKYGHCSSVPHTPSCRASNVYSSADQKRPQQRNYSHLFEQCLIRTILPSHFGKLNSCIFFF